MTQHLVARIWATILSLSCSSACFRLSHMLPRRALLARLRCTGKHLKMLMSSLSYGEQMSQQRVFNACTASELPNARSNNCLRQFSLELQNADRSASLHRETSL